MFKPVKEKQISYNAIKDPDVENLFRKNSIPAQARQEIKDLNELVVMFSEKYHLSDVWGITYKSNPQQLSVRFSESTLNGMETKHPIVTFFEAYKIHQTLEQGDYEHLKYSIFTFQHSQCEDLKDTLEKLKPSADELEHLAEHEAKGQVLC